MARDRQRAKRRQRRAAANPGGASARTHRENVPGELDHASGDVEQVEAAIVAGAEGEPYEEEPVDEQAAGDAGDEPGDEELDLDADDVDDSDLEREAIAAGGGRDAGDGGEPPIGTARPGRPQPGEPTRRGAGRFIVFLRASWAELQRVQWPDRRQVAQATGVVMGFVLVAGAYLGLADALAQRIVNFIL